VALTLRAVGGLTTTEIAGAFLVPEATMAQRIVRAKHRIRAAGVPFPMPAAADREDRLAAVLQVLYLIFNEGYAARSGDQLHRAELTTEAIRLTRRLHRRLPDHGEVAGLLALMLLTDARREARTDPHGRLVPLAEQDRSRWNADQLREGTDLVAAALSGSPVGPYQVEAAIAAVHAGAARVEDTDWPQILALYDVLQRLAPSPLVTLNQAVAAAMVHGPHAGLALLRTVEADPRLAGHHRLAAVRAHLLEMSGDTAGAQVCYRQAAQSTRSVPERHYLLTRANQLPTPPPPDPT
jgi:predicted RNA polymerase sigma factor